MKYDIKDDGLSENGELRIEWAEREMPVLRSIRRRFANERPFEGITIGACLHVTTETANLVITLKEGGAKVYLCASNPLSTQDDVAAALVKRGISVFAVRGEDKERYYRHLNMVVDAEPDITMDDGGDLTSLIHKERMDVIEGVIGGTEETTTGVIRFRVMEKENKLRYPIIAVNDADTKHLFDNRYGTGQSTIDGILRATNTLLAGKTFVVAGYGWCGRGIAMRARGMGANVVVTEVNPLRALEAVMDGFTVKNMHDAVEIGDIFVTATGCNLVIREEHIRRIKDGAILANSGHFNVEIDIKAIENFSINKRKVRDNVDEYRLKNGKKIYLIAEGRLVNLASAEGHPANVMDMSFANQALCAEYLLRYGKELECKVYKVPKEIDRKVAELKLKSMDITIDKLTEEQERYLSSWKEGT